MGLTNNRRPLSAGLSEVVIGRDLATIATQVADLYGLAPGKLFKLVGTGMLCNGIGASFGEFLGNRLDITVGHRRGIPGSLFTNLRRLFVSSNENGLCGNSIRRVRL
ncbi:hypothetical protein BMS3Bbin02_01430 [bacterium BMS3Bbin02]|nr:hypothetical protein BMS3Bbin02_01430 [bacterium BMS3Bbin02]